MQYSFGLIGCGNMGSAIAQAVSQTCQDGILTNRSPQRAEQLAQQLGMTAGDNETAAKNSRYLFLGVKPHLMAGLLAELRPALAARQEPPVLVSMAAGLTIAQIQQMAGQEYPVIRIMPNTPVAVGQGVVLYQCSEQVDQDTKEGFLQLMQKSGQLFPIQESLMDVGAAVSGCDQLFGNVRCRRILHPQSTHRVLIDHAHNAVFDVALFCRTGKPDAFFAVFIILQVRLAGGGCNVEIKALH